MVSRSELARRLEIDRITIWRWEVEGLIPAATRINPTLSGYTPAAVAAITAYAEAAR